MTIVAEPKDQAPSAGGTMNDLGDKDTSAASGEEVLDSLSLSWLDDEVSDANESSSDDEVVNKQADVNPSSFIRPEKSFSQCKKEVKLWSRKI